MKVQQLVCGYSLGEITHEQAARTRAFAQLSHRVRESIPNFTLNYESFAHLYTTLTPLTVKLASKSGSLTFWLISNGLAATGL